MRSFGTGSARIQIMTSYFHNRDADPNHWVEKDAVDRASHRNVGASQERSDKWKAKPRAPEVLCGNARPLADHVRLRALRADCCHRSESRDLSGHRPSARAASHPHRAAVAQRRDRSTGT